MAVVDKVGGGQGVQFGGGGGGGGGGGRQIRISKNAPKIGMRSRVGRNF